MIAAIPCLARASREIESAALGIGKGLRLIELSYSNSCNGHRKFNSEIAEFDTFHWPLRSVLSRLLQPLDPWKWLEIISKWSYCSGYCIFLLYCLQETACCTLQPPHCCKPWIARCDKSPGPWVIHSWHPQASAIRWGKLSKGNTCLDQEMPCKRRLYYIIFWWCTILL